MRHDRERRIHTELSYYFSLCTFLNIAKRSGADAMTIGHHTDDLELLSKNSIHLGIRRASANAVISADEYAENRA